MGRDADDEHGAAADNLHRTMPPNHDARTSKPLLFYKLMVASVVQDDKLKIPGKVVKRIEQDLSIVVTISVPDGRRWNVRLEKHEGKCWFGDGWVEFMKYYNVTVGYFLVFRYKGDSMFVVNIFNLSNAEIQYLPGPVGGSERVGAEKQCSVSKGNLRGNGDAQKMLDSVEVNEEKPCLLTKGKKSGSEGSEKLEYAQANQDKLCSETNGTESGMIRQDKQCLVNKGKESRNNAKQKGSGFETIEAENLSSVTSHTEPGSDETLKKSDLRPPGLGKCSQPTPGTGCVLSPRSDKGESSVGGEEKEMKLSVGAGSLSSILLVKDVSPGYYRANIMSFMKKKQPKKRKAKNPQPTNRGNGSLGFGAEKVELNSLDKKERIPGIHLSKMASRVPTANSLTPTVKPEGSVISQTTTIADGGDKKLPQPDKLYSETQLTKKTMNVPPASQLSVQTPVKRKKEINTADRLGNTVPTTFLAGQKVSTSMADVLNSTSEKTANVQKKQKTIQLSAISEYPINPYCMIPMRVSYVQKKAILNIPANFASKYLQEASRDATLQNLEGKEWKVRLISSNGGGKLSQGWYRFATDNCLKEGDMCIFELLDSVNTLLKVSFIRSPKDHPPADQEVLKL